MKRIAIANRSIDGFGAATTTIIENTRCLKAMGCEIHLYGEHLDDRRIREAGGIGHRLPAWPWGSYFKRRLFAWFFDRAARNKRFDLIIGNGDILDQDVLILHNCVHAAHEAIYGTPLPKDSGVGRMHGRILSERRFRFLVANSDMMKQEILQRFGVPPDSVVVIRPGFDPSKFKPEDRKAVGGPLRRELGIKDGEILVGLVTSGDFRKRGVTILFDALSRLASDLREKIKVLIAGKENHLEPYRDAARQAGLGGRTHFLPPASQVEKYYHALDLFAFPALYEEFGQSVQESMACGVPVLASDRAGAVEMIPTEAHAFMVEKPDAQAFSRRLAAILTQPDLRKRMSKAGIDACRDNTWEKNSKFWRACYEDWLSPRFDSRRG